MHAIYTNEGKADTNTICLGDDCITEPEAGEKDLISNEDTISLSSSVTHSDSFTIVSAASANHFCALEAFLYAINQLRDEVPPSQFPRIVIYNLGVNGSQYPVLEALHKENYFNELYNFDYPSYPSFWNIRHLRGQYAWKAGIVNEMRQKHKGVLLWMDSGNVPNAEFLRSIPQVVRKQGFWSPRSTGFMGGKLIHPGMFKWFKANVADYQYRENCNGAALGFNLDDPKVNEELIIPWKDCAMEKDCIAPPGSSRLNHRQDQAAITFLAYRSGYVCYEYPEFHGITIHQDVMCRDRLRLQAALGKLLHPSSYDAPEWTSKNTGELWQNPDWWTWTPSDEPLPIKH
ncbi:hypothetical protein INT43_007889 [Umbelopsis isabellina]|uniref:Uncharacterized protein n=1 Tax=Mortierella isabellina TaxID=91625 RepID=A0A8H7UD66_MORIS|nr:hypothetical protein INT43_007889 [Umbelopsis isabellina]